MVNNVNLKKIAKKSFSKSPNVISLLFGQCDCIIMISNYSKQMQINSNMVIYFTFEYLIWTKRKGHSSYSN